MKHTKTDGKGLMNKGVRLGPREDLTAGRRTMLSLPFGCFVSVHRIPYFSLVADGNVIIDAEAGRASLSKVILEGVVEAGAGPE